MLRALLAVLIAANLVLFAYSRDWLTLFGLDSLDQREPGRLGTQIRPQSIRILPMKAAASAPAAAATACYETPTFTAADVIAVEVALAGNLPAGSWSDNRGERTVGTKTEITHTYRVVATDPTLAARLATLRLDAAGRGFSFSPCPRPDQPR